ncbi:MAG: hypothetical protein WCJ35_14740 [Planctomycetota bacterium]
MRSPEVPPGAVAIRTYYELNQEAEAFFGDHYSELVIIGRPGIGKSEAFRTHCMEHPDQCHYLEGKITPLPCRLLPKSRPLNSQLWNLRLCRLHPR